MIRCPKCGDGKLKTYRKLVTEYLCVACATKFMFDGYDPVILVTTTNNY